MGGQPLNKPIVDIAFDSWTGRYEVASDGGLFAVDPPFQGSMGGQALNRPVGRGLRLIGVRSAHTRASRRRARVKSLMSSSARSDGWNHPVSRVSSPSGRGTPSVTTPSKTVDTYEVWSPLG